MFHLSCADYVSPLTCLTWSKGICRVCDVLVLFGVWYLWFCLVWLLCSRFFGLFVFPFARLNSFTDWCIAHRQQFREQKNALSSSHGAHGSAVAALCGAGKSRAAALAVIGTLIVNPNYDLGSSQGQLSSSILSSAHRQSGTS